MALLTNECMLGVYRGFLADGDHTTGSTTTQTNNIEALIGGHVQVVMLGGISNPTSVSALGRHIVVHVRMIPAGGSIHIAATAPSTAGYASMWTQVVTDLKSAGRNNADTTVDIAWEGSGSNDWGGVNTTDPATGVASTTQDWVAGFRNVVTTMRSAGLDPGVTIGWNVMSGNMTATQLAQMDPGTSYWDVGGWDGYAGNYLGKYADRNDYQTIYNTQQKPDLDTLTKYCRDRGKRAGMGEMGFPQPRVGDTTSNVYTYRPADTYLYFQLFYEYFKANADVWAFACVFNQNIMASDGGVSEDQQFVYLGTNPASETYPALKNTSSTGPAYLTNSPMHDPAKSLGSYLDYWGGRAGRGGGTCIYTAPPPPPPVPVAVTTAPGARLRPLRAHRGWIKG